LKRFIPSATGQYWQCCCLFCCQRF